MKSFIFILTLLAIAIAALTYTPRKKLVCNVRHCVVCCNGGQQTSLQDMDSVIFIPVSDDVYTFKTPEGVTLMYNPRNGNFYSRDCRIINGDIQVCR